MLLTPSLLTVFLIGAIVRIGLDLLFLPQPLSFPLARFLGTIALVVYTRIGPKDLSAALASNGSHGLFSFVGKTISEETILWKEDAYGNRQTCIREEKGICYRKLGKKKVGRKWMIFGSFFTGRNGANSDRK